MNVGYIPLVISSNKENTAPSLAFQPMVIARINGKNYVS
jgi:hypothetical protein